MSEMLKHQNAGLMLLSKLDNAMAHLMAAVLIEFPNLCPQGCIVLFTLCNNACLASVSCNPSELSRAFDRAVAFPLQ